MAASGHLGNIQVSQPDWGGQIRRMAEVVTMGRSLEDINFVCTAHEKQMRDKQGAIISILPLITGQFASKIDLYFDEIYRSTTTTGTGGKPNYTLIAAPSSLSPAKSRLGLPRSIETNYKAIQEFLGVQTQELPTTKGA